MDVALSPGTFSPGRVLALQQSAGNAAVARMLARQSHGEGSGRGGQPEELPTGPDYQHRAEYIDNITGASYDAITRRFQVHHRNGTWIDLPLESILDSAGTAPVPPTPPIPGAVQLNFDLYDRRSDGLITPRFYTDRTAPAIVHTAREVAAQRGARVAEIDRTLLLLDIVSMAFGAAGATRSRWVRSGPAPRSRPSGGGRRRPSEGGARRPRIPTWREIVTGAVIRGSNEAVPIHGGGSGAPSTIGRPATPSARPIGLPPRSVPAVPAAAAERGAVRVPGAPGRAGPFTAVPVIDPVTGGAAMPGAAAGARPAGVAGVAGGEAAQTLPSGGVAVRAGAGRSGAFSSVPLIDPTTGGAALPQPRPAYNPGTRSDAELVVDQDPTPLPGETGERAMDRAIAAEREAAQRLSAAWGAPPIRIDLQANDAAYATQGAHTELRHSPGLPLARAPGTGVATIEGRVYGDAPWDGTNPAYGGAQNNSARWDSWARANQVLLTYVRANWDAIVRDLETTGEHEGIFDAGGRVGEGYFNENAIVGGPVVARRAVTSVVTVRMRRVPGTRRYYFLTSFPLIRGYGGTPSAPRPPTPARR